MAARRRLPLADGPSALQCQPMPKLTAPEIKSALATTPKWTKRGDIIRRTYEFDDFVAAMKFVNAVAKAAEKARHHPDVDIRWNKVTLALTTHDAGGLTTKDFALAAKSDAFAQRGA